MYARTVTTQTSPDKVDEALQRLRESLVPSLKQQKGFKRAYLFVERSTGKVGTISLWETEADLQASVTSAQELMGKFASFFTAPPTVEHYEVAVEV